MIRTYSVEREELAVKSMLEIAGCNCLFSTNDRSLFESVSRWKSRKGVEAGCDFELRVIVDKGLTRDANAQPQFRGAKQFVFALFHSKESFLLDLFERRVTAVVSRETARDQEFWNTILIPIALGVLGPTMGVAPLHCACLEHDAQGMLVAGISGAGKSTLAVALAKEGFALVSDDWTYARIEQGEVLAYGLQVPVKLMPECSLYFEELSSLRPRIALNGELAFEVNAAETFQVQVAQRCIPSCVVFLERWDSEKSSVEALPRDVARRYFAQSAELLPTELRHAIAEREEIIEQVTSRDCWRFRYGGTPQQGARALQRFFEERYDVDGHCAAAS
jgi:hypothetical protein